MDKKSGDIAVSMDGVVVSFFSLTTSVLGAQSSASLMKANSACVLPSLVKGDVNVVDHIRQPTILCANYWKSVGLSSIELVVIASTPWLTACLTIYYTALGLRLKIFFAASLVVVLRGLSTMSCNAPSLSRLKVPSSNLSKAELVFS